MTYWDGYKKMLLNPLKSMWNSKITASAFAISTTMTMKIQDAIFDLINVDLKLVIGLIILMFMDLFFGILKSRRDNIPITSLRLRQTGIKFVEYGAVCFIFVVFSNMAGDVDVIKMLAFTFLAGVEIKSIIENMSDQNGALKKLFKVISDKINKQFE
jgi:hypothetical protein